MKLSVDITCRGNISSLPLSLHVPNDIIFEAEKLRSSHEISDITRLTHRCALVRSKSGQTIWINIWITQNLRELLQPWVIWFAYVCIFPNFSNGHSRKEENITRPSFRVLDFREITQKWEMSALNWSASLFIRLCMYFTCLMQTRGLFRVLSLLLQPLCPLVSVSHHQQQQPRTLCSLLLSFPQPRACWQKFKWRKFCP